MPQVEIINLDALTYAGNLDNLEGIDKALYTFLCGYVQKWDDVMQALGDGVDAIVNFAAETHVDRSIVEQNMPNPAGVFLDTNVGGVMTLLDMVRRGRARRLVQVSTDEVYGSVGNYSVDEAYPLHPGNPYAATKAAADLLALAYYNTYNVDVVITRGANTVGPYQYPEKVLPLFITNALLDLPLPVYGTGRQSRDYIYVEDHCQGILTILLEGLPGTIYNLGAGNYCRTEDVAVKVLAALGKPTSLIQYVADRAGHDARYRIDSICAHRLGWQPETTLDQAIQRTIAWYQDHTEWWQKIRHTAKFIAYYQQHYPTLPLEDV
jgi:dTDP-glucose 4,6-dehydratase